MTSSSTIRRWRFPRRMPHKTCTTNVDTLEVILDVYFIEDRCPFGVLIILSIFAFIPEDYNQIITHTVDAWLESIFSIQYFASKENVPQILPKCSACRPWALADYVRKKNAQIKPKYVISPGFWCFIVPLGAKPVPTLSVFTKICSSILNLVVWGPVVEASFFFRSLRLD